ncbi:TrkH family potassium uptake protein [Corynebacterium timonense]|uniref:Potassium uptake protein, TrkH family n=1 Tax=Corynebacterium timonense TaxID=441500 RepID=A0A1H1L3Y9_9CORY|nr:potassium transporter TrkG [Corynebacterium timonense]SDR68992.1 potassium uptake protein, TrkH family [Corynebacterium timonense]
MEQKSFPRRLGPARLTTAGFLALILVGTVLLCLPFSSADGQATAPLPALFTATSATTLTGLVVVDTGSHWSVWGQLIVLCLIQVGGFGIMSVATLTGMLITGRVSLRSRRSTAAEGRPISGEGVRATLVATLVLTAACEAVVAVTLGLRFAITYDMPALRAAWEGVFHAVSAFNNAGFGLRSDSLVSYNTDAWVLLPLAGALMIGGLGFPVLSELYSRAVHGPRRLSVTTRITLVGTLVLVVSATALVALSEWRGVLADMPLGVKLLNAFFSGVTPRTAGFNSVDYGQAHPITLMLTDIYMFIGGGSAGTAGGIKITTAIVLLGAMFAEFRGRGETVVAKRSVPASAVRQALTVAAAGLAAVALGVAALRVFDPEFTADQVAFEVVSAFATVGLSTGITAQLSAASQCVLCVLMFLGRVGPFTLVAALAAHNVARRFDYPKERPFIG